MKIDGSIITRTAREFVGAIKQVCETIKPPGDNNVLQPWPSHIYFEDISAQSQFDLIEIIMETARNNDAFFSSGALQPG